MQPNQLQRIATRDALNGIQNGRWRGPVGRVRQLDHGSDDQKAAKRGLPYVTWSGLFAYRNKDRLVKHSGQVGIDVDDLSPKGCVNVLKRALEDRRPAR